MSNLQPDLPANDSLLLPHQWAEREGPFCPFFCSQEVLDGGGIQSLASVVRETKPAHCLANQLFLFLTCRSIWNGQTGLRSTMRGAWGRKASLSPSSSLVQTSVCSSYPTKSAPWRAESQFGLRLRPTNRQCKPILVPP